jgi:hypothetical protein
LLRLADINQPQRAEETVRPIPARFQGRAERRHRRLFVRRSRLAGGRIRARPKHYFARILDSQPKSQFREQIRYLLANAKFMAANYEEAVAAYKKYLAEFPQGPKCEDVNYGSRSAPFSRQIPGRDASASGVRREKHPSGSFLPDAKYRLAVCKYAASVYDEVDRECQAWEREFPNNPQLGRSVALLGDALCRE